MIVMCFVALILSVIYVFLLRWIAKPLIYVSLFAIFLLGLLGGYWAWMKREDFLEGTFNYKQCKNFGIRIWAITALYTFFVCC
jgi:ABC-type bacteriocin/lantibiotic exporter with double-glycine peptidase domain